MPAVSRQQYKFIKSVSEGDVKAPGLSKKQASEYVADQNPNDLPKYKSKGGKIMSLADAIKKKKEKEELRSYWRGGLAIDMPSETVGDDGIKEAREHELGEQDDALIAESKKKESPKADMSDTKDSAVLDQEVKSYAEGGSVTPPMPEHHTPEHFSELNEKERFQAAMKHLDAAHKMLQTPQAEEMPHDQGSDPSMEKPEHLAEGGEVASKEYHKPHEAVSFSHLDEKLRMQAALKHLDGKKPEESSQPEEMPHDQGSDPSQEKPMKLAKGGEVDSEESFSEPNEKVENEESQSLEHPIAEETNEAPKADLKKDQVEMSQIMDEHKAKYKHGDTVKMEHIKEEHRQHFAMGGMPKLDNMKRFLKGIDKAPSATKATFAIALKNRK